ncbi:hypothetical protein AWC38_SpisGene4360 [Stylophora pistillata]|uniref:Uncharacterized protein n=1 Tax=Stylophora pistillata TaxID=50429 RepID=A0A2B4SNX6_STYPI|nr:hypothetical protein AWC38_SpisGene4360 [Stylophora pistillata]
MILAATEKFVLLQIGSQLQQEPLLRAKKLGRRLSVQNNQLNSNWEIVKSSLDKIRLFSESKMEKDKNETLKYQEKLRGSSGTYQFYEEVSKVIATPRRRETSITLGQWEATKQQNPGRTRQRRSSISSESSAQTSTVSFEQKRVLRRRSSFSLLDLRKLNEGLAGKSRLADNSKPSLDPLDEEPASTRGSVIENIEADDEPIRLPPTVRLPPIHQLRPQRLSTRNFGKDFEFEKRTRSVLDNLEDLKYCRYLRNARRN